VALGPFLAQICESIRPVLTDWRDK
jgi:hypothetical protein